MKAIIVDKKGAENLKRKLISKKILNNNFRVKHDSNYVYFPVLKDIKGYKTVDVDFERKAEKLTFDESLMNLFNKNEISELKRAYEIIGSIAILEIDKKFENREREIADALLCSNKCIKTVVKKISSYEGEFRLRRYKYLAGLREKETIHKENGISVKLNIDKTYFSARLANERLYIARQVKSGENVLVMFSGVGIYPLVIAKNSKPKIVYGVEMNLSACKYAEENVKLNKLNNVKLYCGDVRKVVPKLDIEFDRIVMPHPCGAVNFLDIALKVLKKNGIIHFYSFCRTIEIENIWNEITEYIKQYKKLGLRTCCQVGPNKYRICADLQVC
jgi:tRNA (guanine37-N1)-methyltransferase